MSFFDYHATASGSLDGNRRQISGSGNAGFLLYEYANWNSLIAGSNVTGTFLFRLSAQNPGGFVEWDMVLSNVTRTSL